LRQRPVGATHSFSLGIIPRKSHFAEAAQYAAQVSTQERGTDQQTSEQEFDKPGDSDESHDMAVSGLGGTGFEPVTSAV
jgi:hypothetical protein